MVVLLVAYNVYHLVDREVTETHVGGTDVLSHIYAGTIGAQKQLLVKSLVGEVCPYAVVVLAEEEALAETFLYLGLTLKICV